MRPGEILLLLANLLTFFALAVPPLRAVSWTRYAAVIALLLAISQALIEGPRWQMVPAYALAGLLFLVGLLPNIAPTGRLAVGLGVGLGVLALAVSSALPFLIPVFRLPQPTGPYQIGTLTYHWVDTGRSELFTAEPNDHRELMVQIWYPAEANPSSARAPYVQDPAALAPLARLLHLPGFVFEHFKYVTTNATSSAPVAAGEPGYPVLIFSGGRGGFRQESTQMFEELVSHGYIVAAIDHPYASSGVVFPDGRLVTLDPRLLPGPTGGIPAGTFFHDVVIPYLAQDVIFTLDQLTALNQADPSGILTGRLDLQRAGMFGPSLGGVVGAEACYLEPRLRACQAMDAYMPADVVRAGLKQPTMFISREVKWMQIEGWSQGDIDATQNTMRAVYDSLPGDGYLVLVQGMFHANFADTAFYSPLMTWLGITGPIDGDRANSVIGSYTLAFFDHELKGQPAALLDGPAEDFPEVLFETRRPQSTAANP
jgi:predicted dienelactone hydrolase